MSFNEYVCNRWLNKVPNHALRQYVYRKAGMTIGEETSIFRDVEIINIRGITIGRHCVIGWWCLLDGRGTLSIGDNVNISSYSIIHTASHDVQSPDFAGYVAPVVIGNHAWLATRSLILPGVTIGEGAVVAAGAVVNKDVPPFTIVGGVPARPIGQRTRDLTYNLAYRPPWY